MNIGKNVNGANEQINNSTLEKYCYNDDASSECVAYGGLYQWNEAMQYSVAEGAQGICPTGWHIPTDAEQYALESYLTDSPNTCDGGRTSWDCDAAGTALTVGGSSGFEGLKTGGRDTDGIFGAQGSRTYFWSSSINGSDAWYRFLYSGFVGVGRNAYSQNFGFSVRCIQN